MLISELLDTERVLCQASSSSKKRVLEDLATLLTNAVPGFSDGEIFNSLIERERLGSTGLGNGVALPHGRMSGLKAPFAAMIVLNDGIDFDAIDTKPVDILFALLVPEESTDEHLQILAKLAEMFSANEVCTELRACTTSHQCLSLIRTWKSKQQLSA